MAPWLFAAAAGLKAAGSIYSGWQQAKSLEEQANETELLAGRTRARGIEQQIAFNEDSRRLLGVQRQLLGQAGVRATGAGANLLARSRTARVQDRMQLARNSQWQVEGLYADAEQLREAADAARISGLIGAASGAFSSFQ